MMIVISCVDAGSANFLLPVIPLIKQEVVFFTSGSATEIFDSADVTSQKIETIDWIELREVAKDIVEKINPDLLLCGTSWGLSLDKALTLEAKKFGITTISTIDHWRLLRERYIDTSESVSTGELTFITDFVFAIDNKVKQSIVGYGIDSSRVFVVGNPHLEFIENTYSNLNARVPHRKAYSKDILFVSEIVRDDLPNNPYDEYGVLEDLLSLSISLGLTLDIKLHPNEHTSKFSSLVSQSIYINKDIDYFKMVSEYKFIVGMDSMLLFEMSICRPRVISYRPNCGNESNNLFDSSSVLTAYTYSELESLCQSGLDKPFSCEKKYGGSAVTVSDYIDDLMELV